MGGGGSLVLRAVRGRTKHCTDEPARIREAKGGAGVTGALPDRRPGPA